MRQQEIFNQAANHMLTQGKRSVKTIDGEQTCAYRGANGLKCVVGYFIPDDKYYPDLECIGVHMSEVYNALPFECTPVIVDLLSTLQTIHDVYKPEVWKDRLTDMANVRGLNMPSVG